MSEVNYLEVGDEFHCLRCHKDLPTKNDGMIEHHKVCKIEITYCKQMNLKGEECEFKEKQESTSELLTHVFYESEVCKYIGSLQVFAYAHGWKDYTGESVQDWWLKTRKVELENILFQTEAKRIKGSAYGTLWSSKDKSEGYNQAITEIAEMIKNII